MTLPTLWAVSDLHVRHADNRAVVEGLRPRSAAVTSPARAPRAEDHRISPCRTPHRKNWRMPLTYYR